MTTTHVSTTDGPARIAVRSQALGDIEVPGADAIRFCDPIPGFPGCTEYALVPHLKSDGSPNDSVMWLQALEAPFHAFIVTDPWAIVADYAPEIPDSEAEALQLRSFEDARVLVILTVPRDGGVSVNLRAPIVFNIAERIAKQVVLISDQYSTRQTLG